MAEAGTATATVAFAVGAVLVGARSMVVVELGPPAVEVQGVGEAQAQRQAQSRRWGWG